MAAIKKNKGAYMNNYIEEIQKLFIIKEKDIKLL